MSENKLVSIIVPVYGVEAYLEECLDSLLNQTYKNFEIILVDDESPDKCPEICDTYAKKDNRIKVVHQKNGGAGSARNTGLSLIQGEYVCFVDSDDYVSSDYLKILVEALENENSDIVVSNFYNKYVNETLPFNRSDVKTVYSKIEYLEYFLKDWTCSLIWNKLYKAYLLKDIRFEEGRKIDDEFFTYQAVLNANKINYVNEYLYYYRMRASSVMSQSKTSKNAEQVFKDQHDYYMERYKKITRTLPELQSAYLENLMENLISLKYRSYGFTKIDKMIQESFKSLWKDILLVPVAFKSKYIFIRNMMLPIKPQSTSDQSDSMDRLELYK